LINESIEVGGDVVVVGVRVNMAYVGFLIFGPNVKEPSVERASWIVLEGLGRRGGKEEVNRVEVIGDYVGVGYIA
jgi:hypothetical protein